MEKWLQEWLRNSEKYGMQPVFDMLYADSRNGSNFYHLYDKIVDPGNILLARDTLCTLGSIADIDDDSVVPSVHVVLADYKPVAGDLDILIQQCFLQVLEPIMEAKFYRHSYGYRPCRNESHALARVNSLINRGKMYYCVDADLEQALCNMDFGHLSRQLWSFGIRDRRVLAIIRKMVGQGSSGFDSFGRLAGFFINVCLDCLDHWVEMQWELFPVGINIHVFHNTTGKRSGLKSGYIVRYGSRFVILCRSYGDAVRFGHAVENYLRGHMGLDVDGFPVLNLKRKGLGFLGFDIKAIRKESAKNGWVVRTKMTAGSKVQASMELKCLLKDIQHHGADPRRALAYNAAVGRIKAYYQYATDVYCDLDRIGMSVVTVMKNRLKDRGKWSTCGEQPAWYRKRNPGIRLSTRVMAVGGIPLDIINGVKHKSPMNFQQDMTPYTKVGCAKILGKHRKK